MVRQRPAFAALIGMAASSALVCTPSVVKAYSTSVLSGGFAALDLGVLGLSKSARARAGVGLGIAGQLRVGAEFWDSLSLATSIVVLTPRDRRPIKVPVIDCTSVGGTVIGCGDEVSDQESVVQGGALSFEAGYQVRLQFQDRAWLLPTLLLGYQQNVSTLERKVTCGGCPDAQKLDLVTSGMYLAPAMRVAFGEKGWWALGLRSQWFVTGDVTHISLLSIEVYLH